MKKSILAILILLIPGLTKAQWEMTGYHEDMVVSDIHFISYQVGFVCGYRQVYKTTDGEAIGPKLPRISLLTVP